MLVLAFVEVSFVSIGTSMIISMKASARRLTELQ